MSHKLQVISNRRGKVIAFSVVPSAPGAGGFVTIAPASPTQRLHEIEVPADAALPASVAEVRSYLRPHLQAKGLSFIDEPGAPAKRKRAGASSAKTTKKVGSVRRRKG